jgi:CO/xanthine dehydrogenase Mo-binding subunit
MSETGSHRNGHTPAHEHHEGPDHGLRVVGRSVPRVDGPAKVTGRARYTLDLRVPGMAQAAVVRSDRAHAEIVAIDTAAA